MVDLAGLQLLNSDPSGEIADTGCIGVSVLLPKAVKAQRCRRECCGGAAAQGDLVRLELVE
jgi:hypothetical protein